MNSTFRDHMLVINRRPFGEADILVTLLTQYHGKVRAIAKGARKPTSRLVGHSELFSLMSAQINTRSSMPIVSQVVIVRASDAHHLTSQTLQKLSYISEIVDKSLEEGDSHESVFHVLNEGLVRLWATESSIVFAGIVMRLLGLLGFALELRRCAVCECSLVPGEAYGWSFSRDGVVSGQCLQHANEELCAIDGDILKVLRYCQRHSFDDIARLQVPEPCGHAIERFLDLYIQHVLEQPMKSKRSMSQ
jgi:DNA repair protein RecO (recombination protein O)